MGADDTMSTGSGDAKVTGRARVYSNPDAAIGTDNTYEDGETVDGVYVQARGSLTCSESTDRVG